MKYLLLIAISLVCFKGSSQINRYSKATPAASYEPMSFSELATVAQYKRAAYDRNQEYLYNLKKWILDLKSEITEDRFISRLDGQYSVLTSLEDDDLANATNVLKKREMEIREIISDYNLYIKNFNNNQQKTTYKSRDNTSINISELNNRAYKLIQDGQYEEASKLTNRAISIEPDNEQSRFLNGLIHLYGFNNYIKAVAEFQKVINRSHEPKIAHYYKALAHYYDKDYSNTISDMRIFLTYEPENTDALFMSALAKSEVSDLYGAIRDYDEIIHLEKEANPTVYKFSTVYNNKAYCLVRQGKYKEALPLVNKALDMDKSEAYIWDTRGEIYYKLGDFKSSIEDMNKALEIQENENSYFIRGLSNIKLGNKEEGCRDLSMSGEFGNSEAYEKIQEYCN